MRLEASGGNNRSALPLPLAGEGWGGGAASEVDVTWQAVSPTRRALSSAIAEAPLRRSYLRTAAEGGLCSPASGRGELHPRTDRFNQNHPALARRCSFRKWHQHDRHRDPANLAA